MIPLAATAAEVPVRHSDRCGAPVRHPDGLGISVGAGVSIGTDSLLGRRLAAAEAIVLRVGEPPKMPRNEAASR